MVINKQLPKHNRIVSRILENVPDSQFTPKPYHYELINAALSGHSIICTEDETCIQFVIWFIIKYFLHIDNSKDVSHPTCIYVNNNVSKCRDIIQSYKMHLCVDIKYVCTNDLDITGYQLLILSSDDLLYLIDNGVVSLSNIKLLVIEDCDAVLKVNDSLNILSNKLLEVTKKPHLLCSTTALLKCISSNKRSDSLESVIQQLESIFQCSVTFASDVLSAFIYGGCPTEKVLYCDKFNDPTGLFDTMWDIFSSQLDWLEDCEEEVWKLSDDISGKMDVKLYCIKAVKECLKALCSLGPWGGNMVAKVCLKHLLTVEYDVVDVDGPFPTLFLRSTITCLITSQKIFADVFDKFSSVDQFWEIIPPKVKTLLDLVKVYEPKQDFTIEIMEGDLGEIEDDDDSMSDVSDMDDMKGSKSDLPNPNLMPYKVIPTGDACNTEKLNGLVFVKDRFTAYALARLIEELCIWDESLFFVHSGHIFSLTTRSSGQQRCVKDYVRKFRQGDTNLLIATEVLETQGEFPKCNLVVRFHLPDTFSSFIQSKNRARTFNSTYALLVSPEETDFVASSYRSFVGTQNLLMRQADNESALLNQNAGSCADAFYDHSYQPFGPDGPQITMKTAIPLINKYCAKLPSDVFTALVPKWKIESSGSGLFVCRIRMPINSSLKEEVSGLAMPNVQLAKMSAALETAKLLHITEQLDDDLNPIGKEDLIAATAYKDDEEADELMILELEETDLSHSHTGGGAKRRQLYYKRLASELSSCLPSTSTYTSRLILINSRLTTPIASDVFRVEQCSRSFALITTKSLPTLPHFPVFSRSGEETISFTECGSVALTEEQLNTAQQFHRIVFQRLLRLEKDSVMKLNFELAEFQPVVTLLTKNETAGDSVASYSIDWDFIQSVIEANKLDPPCEMKPEKPFLFNTEMYSDAVISPSYRNFDQPQFYYVTDIRNDLSPCSPFPTDAYDSFKEYYAKKYNMVLTNSTQPLLDVDHTSIRLNLMLPRSVNSKGEPMLTTEEKKRSMKDNLQQKQLFIPELCYRHIFPASVWRQAVCLPTILYRLNYLLLANQLRDTLSRETGIGQLAANTTEFEKLAFVLSVRHRNRMQEDPEPLVMNEEDLSDTDAKLTGLTIEEVVEGKPEKPDSDSFIAKLNKDLAGEVEVLLCADEDVNFASANKDTDFGEFCSSDYEKVEAENVKVVDDYVEDLDDAVSDTDSVDSFDEDVTFSTKLDLATCPGPSPCDFLQCITSSNANDFMNLERLETVGDSFLKFAVTLHLYCLYPTYHEGKLSFLRSRQVCNSNLYRLGKNKNLGELFVGSKFEPRENWLPPGYVIKFDSRLPQTEQDTVETALVPFNKEVRFGEGDSPPGKNKRKRRKRPMPSTSRASPCFLQIQQNLTDKSIADAVEAIIGIYLTTCNEEAALRVCAWFGIEVARTLEPEIPSCQSQAEPVRDLSNLAALERILKYRFAQPSLLLQAVTHASDASPDATDCYQRLEFLGDAVLDYVITRFLFQDSQQHSPGVLTDLRSALVNNNIFGALAVKWDFHKFLRCGSPALHHLIDQFVRFQKVKKDDDLEFVTSEEADFDERGDDLELEIPKCLGDMFESVAGAVFLDSGLSLTRVWEVFRPLMKERIERYTSSIPKSLVRELLEMEPESAKFERPTRTNEGRIRVLVHVIGKGRFAGVGRNYRLARNSAAKKALRALKALERRSLHQSVLEDAAN